MDHNNIKKFIKFYDSNLDSVYRFCYTRTSNSELSKDITQQAFMKTWIYVKEKDAKINVRALVYKITRNLIIDWYRKRKEESLDKIIEEDNIQPESNLRTDQEANTNLTLEMLNDLSEPDKELIILRYINNLKPSEIAESLDKDVNSTTVAIHRAKNRLKEIIKKKYNENF